MYKHQNTLLAVDPKSLTLSVLSQRFCVCVCMCVCLVTDVNECSKTKAMLHILISLMQEFLCFSCQDGSSVETHTHTHTAESEHLAFCDTGACLQCLTECCLACVCALCVRVCVAVCVACQIFVHEHGVPRLGLRYCV